jgi:hypothetical protein
MALEKPQLRINIQLSNYLTLAKFPAGLADMGNAVKHQHIGDGQLGIAWAKHLAVATADKFLSGVVGFLIKREHK